MASGRITAASLCGDLAELTRGTAPGRRSVDEITLFKSVGCAIEDLAAAESDAYVLQAEEVVVCHRCSVETLSVTALSRALTSAVIQVW